MLSPSLTFLGTALKRVMDTEGMDLEIIINPKAMSDGQAVIQVLTLPSHRLWHPADFQLAVGDRCRSGH